MSGTPRGSFLSGTLGGLFQPKPKKASKTTARRTGAKAMARKNGRNGRKGKARANPYQAAGIEPGLDCACDAVKRVAGQRFLVRDVPPIPMPDCDQPGCQCAYVRYKDRRNWIADRRTFFGIRSELYLLNEGDDRRTKKDRRVSEESVARRDIDESLDNFESWFTK